VLHGQLVRDLSTQEPHMSQKVASREAGREFVEVISAGGEIGLSVRKSYGCSWRQATYEKDNT
jgi:hypothetical protein